MPWELQLRGISFLAWALQVVGHLVILLGHRIQLTQVNELGKVEGFTVSSSESGERDVQTRLANFRTAALDYVVPIDNLASNLDCVLCYIVNQKQEPLQRLD